MTETKTNETRKARNPIAILVDLAALRVLVEDQGMHVRQAIALLQDQTRAEAR